MKFSDLTQPLYEAPIPPDWDKEKFSSKATFKNMVAYALKQAKKVGTGSGRVAVNVPYEGRSTVIKVARNKKGLAQNAVEAKILSDPKAQQTGILIPIIDYDDENTPPRWIHTEAARQMTVSGFDELFGMSLDKFDALLRHVTGSTTFAPDVQQRFEKIIKDNELLSKVLQFSKDWGLPPRDFGRIQNWGWYKNRPVIIDVGFSEDVAELYRPRSRRKESYSILDRMKAAEKHFGKQITVNGRPAIITGLGRNETVFTYRYTDVREGSPDSEGVVQRSDIQDQL